ncbi:MAG: hypothetical protein ACFFCW_26890 [Candidatus Hodarchaeota archaeon]
MMKNKTLRQMVILITVTLCLTIVIGQVNANPTTLNVRVSASSDDAEESLEDGSMDLHSSDLELGTNITTIPRRQAVGMRFVDIGIPQGVPILDAAIQFTVDEFDDEVTNVRIFGELTPDSAAFSIADFDITSRSLTTSSVVWANIPLWVTAGDAGPDQLTPDLGTIIQEIVDQPGWTVGNALSIIIFPEPITDSRGERTAESFNGSASKAPLLTVKFIPAPSALALTVVGVLSLIRWRRQ